jgi:2-polyprenyl-6-methoxyphenol hydroxylase-like FAD-dependent oxidoreductase
MGSFMGSDLYDIITVGGGLGGSALATAMAEHGAKILVLERETHFKDRVRGENLAPWGVAETQVLGLYELLRTTCAHEAPWFEFSMASERGEPRDLLATTPQQLPFVTFYHPVTQEVLLQATTDAGAEIRRGASVRDVDMTSVVKRAILFVLQGTDHIRFSFSSAQQQSRSQ